MVPWSFLEVPLWKLRGDGSLKRWSGLHSPGPSPSKAFCSGIERVQFLGLPQPGCMVAWMKDQDWGGAKWAGSQVSMQSWTTNGSLTGERKNVSSGKGGGGCCRAKRLCVYDCVLLVDAGGDECVCFLTASSLEGTLERNTFSTSFITLAVSCHLRAHTYVHAHGRPCTIITAQYARPSTRTLTPSFTR